MERMPRILVVDDDDQWREMMSDTLLANGFRADSARDVNETLSLLKANFYHLIILDIRLEDDNEENLEGMALLRKLKQLSITPGVEVMMLSGYGNLSQMREAFKEYEVYDFLNKSNFDNIKFVSALENAFKKDFNINLALEIHWQGTDKNKSIENLLVYGKRIKKKSNLFCKISEELTDLISKLFYDAKSVIVSKIQQGLSGTGVLKVLPFYKTGPGQEVIIKFGEKKMILKEKENYKNYIEKLLNNRRHTNIQNLCYTQTLGGIVYSFLGAPAIDINDFRSFYDDNDAESIANFFKNLFDKTCVNWYDNKGIIKPYNLNNYYFDLLGLSIDKIYNAINFTKNIEGGTLLTFKNLKAHKTFQNPVSWLKNQTFIMPTYESIVHGDFNPSNIFSDDTQKAWLIDFYRTGPGHILCDFCQLDSMIRYTLVGPDEATLKERYCLELELARVTSGKTIESIDANVDDSVLSNNVILKAFKVVSQLRFMARKLTSIKKDFFREYHTALLFFSLNTIRFQSLPAEQREHALLSACIIVKTLSGKTTNASS